PVAEALGRLPDELIGRPLIDLFDLAVSGQESERTLLFHFTARSGFQELPMRAAIPGETRWWSVSGRPIYDDLGNFVGFRGSGTDLTEKKRSEEQASRLARYDSLTGLANPSRCRRRSRRSSQRRMSSTAPVRFCCWTSTGSSRLTTQWGIPRAMRCSSRWHRDSSELPAMSDRSAAAEATSSKSSFQVGSTAERLRNWRLR